MQYLYHVLSLREPVFIRPAELGGIQQIFFIKEAEDEGDLPLKKELLKKRKIFAKQMNMVYRGKIHKEADSTEKARKAVSKSIKDSIESTRETHSALHEHLSTTIKTGHVCIYISTDPPPWSL